MIVFISNKKKKNYMFTQLPTNSLTQQTSHQILA